MPSWLEGLNLQQREAVLHGEGPLLIVAGAGTGKTRTLASRVAHLVSAGTPPDRILLLTFTRRASAEMITRAKALLADDGGGGEHAAVNSIATALLTSIVSILMK